MNTSANMKTYRQTFAAFVSCAALTGWLIGFALLGCLLSPPFEQQLERFIGAILMLIPN